MHELLHALKLQLYEMRDAYFGVEKSVRELGGRAAGSIKPRYHAIDARTVMSLLGICTFSCGAMKQVGQVMMLRNCPVPCATK